MLKMSSVLTLIICLTFGLAAAQVTTDDVVVCEAGKIVKLTIKNLTAAGVGNIHVAHIEALHGDEVSIYGTMPGETLFEFRTRDGRKNTLKLQVVSKNGMSPRRVSASTPKTLEVGTLNVTPGPSEEPKEPIVPSQSMAVVDTQPSAATATTLPTASIEPRRMRVTASRLQISLEPYVLIDTEQYPVTHVEHGEDGHSHINDTPEDEVEFATVRKSVKVLPLTFRYDISSRNSLTMIIPFVSRTDEIILGKDKRKTVTNGLGDIQLGFERVFPRLMNSGWDGVLGVTAGLPTGRSIYNANERNSPLGLGQYEVGSQINVRRVFDPLALNAGVGVYYTIPRTVNEQKINPGVGHSLHTGFAYALNDRLTFSEQLNYTSRPNVFLNSPNDLQFYKNEQAYLTHGLLLNPRDGSHVFRMFFTVGLTPTSADRGFGFSYIYQRKRSTR